MLDLKIAGESVDLYPDATITIDEESPVFEKDTIPGGYSFPFTLPITPRNRRILGFPERIEKAGAMTRELPFELFFMGRLRLSGTVSVTEVEDEYRAYLQVSNGDLNSRLKDLKLKDLDLGGTRTWEWKTEYNRRTDDFALFPVYNPEFGKYTTDPAFANNKYRLNSFESGAFYHVDETHYVICPFPFLTYIIQQIFKHLELQVIENILASDPDFQDLVLYTNFDITSQSIAYNMEEVVIGTDVFGNDITQQVNVGSNFRVQDEWNMADLMPDMLVSDFLKSLRNKLNLAVIVEAGGKVRIVKRTNLVNQAFTRNITEKVTGSPSILSITPPDGFKLSQIQDTTDLLFKDFWQDIEPVISYLKDPVANTAELGALEPTINEIRLVQSLNKYYRYQKQNTGTWYYGWQEFSLPYQNYLSGNREETFESAFSTLDMVDYQRVIGGPFIRMPYTKQQGNCSEAPEYTDFKARLLLYRGLLNDSTNNPTPSGSNDNLDREGNVLAGKNLTLSYEGAYGLYEQLWKDYIAWWMNRKQVNWMVKNPDELQFNEKYAIDGKHYLLKKRTINLGVNSIEPSLCEFYLV